MHIWILRRGTDLRVVVSSAGAMGRAHFGEPRRVPFSWFICVLHSALSEPHQEVFLRCDHSYVFFMPR